MKFFTTTLLLAALCISSIGYSQNSKHSISSAKIVYRITQTTTKEVAIKPMEYTLFIKKDMSRVEMESEKGKMTMISDNLARTAYMLMDNSGSKIAMKMNLEAEMQKKGIDKDPEVEITRESKVIAGYTCYKAIIKSTTKGDKETYDVWFTSDIKKKYGITDYTTRLASTDVIKEKVSTAYSQFVISRTVQILAVYGFALLIAYFIPSYRENIYIAR